MDGQESRWSAAWEFLPGTEVTEILDLLHGASYLGEAALLFLPTTSAEASAFVKAQLRRMLEGHIATVIRALRRQTARHKLKGKLLEDLERICNYLHSNAHRMAFDPRLETINGFFVK